MARERSACCWLDDLCEVSAYKLSTAESWSAHRSSLQGRQRGNSSSPVTDRSLVVPHQLPRHCTDRADGCQRPAIRHCAVREAIITAHHIRGQPEVATSTDADPCWLAPNGTMAGANTG